MIQNIHNGKQCHLRLFFAVTENVDIIDVSTVLKAALSHELIDGD
ncbi:Hypothetical protein CAP_6795 [Chondromyces apiculatus DSM 436]|uniref:Uncharacterized protein n=1 Tax=Chondromyces apiculatus DSM 436 TaxID=1192034 RepID=A0A017TEP6_9BACT|nr:Hypothetical protein CAP_6795 [Chondromyces apiculatus DSM 436]